MYNISGSTNANAWAVGGGDGGSGAVVRYVPTWKPQWPASRFSGPSSGRWRAVWVVNAAAGSERPSKWRQGPAVGNVDHHWFRLRAPDPHCQKWETFVILQKYYIKYPTMSYTILIGCRRPFFSNFRFDLEMTLRWPWNWNCMFLIPSHYFIKSVFL